MKENIPQKPQNTPNKAKVHGGKTPRPSRPSPPSPKK